ncbi:hypothetical protein AMJ52_04110 [candidate division TA06 bacterium DG_78]|uniref:FlgD/Vpr Ig-like domain-containing protein n=1 Tax=candidate division TA06 bacterium DG_78 TaxID=1703772 RepID=A0A0S7YEH6_UNCT6|nr:MAG: hypothetical protein AMJ52_04110 [candidate division TA06 bacterium DG_78]
MKIWEKIFPPRIAILILAVILCVLFLHGKRSAQNPASLRVKIHSEETDGVFTKDQKMSEPILAKYTSNRNDGTFEFKGYLREDVNNLSVKSPARVSPGMVYSRDSVDFQIVDSLSRPNSGGPVVIGDSDHDSLMEIIYEIFQPGLYPLIIYEYNPGTQKFDSVWTIGDSLPIFDIGDIDGDNKTEVLTQYKDSIRVYESVDSTSYPSALTWSHVLPMNIHYHGQIVDLDQDGNKEILIRECTGPTTYRIKIYECIGDNQFDSVFASPIYSYNGRNRAVGDFDQDGKMEFTAMDGNIIQVFENQGDNIYSEVWEYDWQQLNCQSTHGDDVDNDGLPEIIYGGNTDNNDYFAIFERAADDSFTISWDTIIPGLGSGVLANVTTGNVSFGPKQELVLTAYDQWHVYRCTGNDQYEFVYSYAFGVGHGLWGNTSAANVDGDSRDEIIVGSQYTGGLFVFKDINMEADTTPPTISILFPTPEDTIETDSVVIYAYYQDNPGGVGIDTSCTDLTMNDDTLSAVVTDTMISYLAEDLDDTTYTLMLVVSDREGNSTDSTWNFYVNAVTVKEQKETQQLNPHSLMLYPNCPNPFSQMTEIKFQIPNRETDSPLNVTIVVYDVTGQRVRSLVDKEFSSGTYTVTWDGKDESGEYVSAGVYFYRLKTDRSGIVRKMLKLK